MKNKVAQYAEKHDMLPEGARVLCALSGGADSVCLLSVLREMGVSVCAAHFNHCLRGQEADRDEEFCRELCAGLGVEFISGRGDVAAYAKEKKLGTEEAGRELRYAFLEETAEKLRAQKIATAHNACDNAETLLLNLMRGAGTRGMGGIPPVRGRFIRPLLCVTRDEIEAYLAERGLGYVTDSSNLEDDYMRNRVRHGVLPALLELCPDFYEKAARTAELCRRDDEYLSAEAEKLISGGKAEVKTLLEAPGALRTRALKMLAEGAGGRADAAKVAAMEALLENPKPSAEADVGRGVKVRREYGIITAARGEKKSAFAAFSILPGEEREIQGTDFSVKVSRGEAGKSGKNIFYLRPEAISGEIIVRPRKTGDEIRLSKKAARKSLKKLFIERKIPAARRQLVPIIADDKGVLAVSGFGADAGKTAETGEQAVIIEIKSSEEQI